jgi:hypothetical protein
MMGIQQVEHLGRIRRLTIPDGWIAQTEPEDLFSQSWKRSFLAAQDEQVELIIYYRGVPIDEQTASTFSAIAAGKPGVHGAEKLAPNEIISLRIMMGFGNSGNNQYTNSNAPDSADGPVFDLRQAEIRRISNQVVLFISGKYRQGSYFSGIFYQADDAGRIIHQIGINAPSSQAMAKYIDDLEQVLGSIEWDSGVAP